MLFKSYDLYGKSPVDSNGIRDQVRGLVQISSIRSVCLFSVNSIFSIDI